MYIHQIGIMGFIRSRLPGGGESVECVNVMQSFGLLVLYSKNKGKIFSNLKKIDSSIKV